MNPLTGHAEMLQLVTFRLGGQKFAVDILKVQEIDNMKEITRIPNSPPYLAGAINLRGKVIPVLSMSTKFGLADKTANEQDKIVIMDIRGIVMGIIVDSVSDVLRISPEVVEPPPPVSSTMSAKFIRGIAKLESELVILLDMDQLLNIDEQHAVFGSTGATA